jgi:hypothetical protein
MVPIVSAADSRNISSGYGKERTKDPAEDHDYGKSRVGMNRAKQKHF